MIKSKLAIISSFILLGICLYMFFPFPDNLLLDAETTFMNFPIQEQNGYIMSGIVCSVLFIFGIILLAFGMKKHRTISIVIVLGLYVVIPNVAIALYQRMVATGISAVSYDEKGSCNFESEGEKLINGECMLTLANHSKHKVSFAIQLLDDIHEPAYRMESLMNEPELVKITLQPHEKRKLHLEKQIDVSGISRHVDGGTSNQVHFKLTSGKDERIF